jgi:hypothetical protein
VFTFVTGEHMQILRLVDVEEQDNTVNHQLNEFSSANLLLAFSWPLLAAI